MSYFHPCLELLTVYGHRCWLLQGQILSYAPRVLQYHVQPVHKAQLADTP